MNTEIPMQPSDENYKKLLTEVIKKQIAILGPGITLSKARDVKGLTVDDNGTVTNVNGNPQEVTQALIDQFVQLSGLIVKKTMEPLLSLSQPSQEAVQSETPYPAKIVANQTPPTNPPVTNPVPTNNPLAA